MEQQQLKWFQFQTVSTKCCPELETLLLCVCVFFGDVFPEQFLIARLNPTRQLFANSRQPEPAQNSGWKNITVTPNKVILLKICCCFCSVWGSLASEMLHRVLHGSLNVVLRIRVCTHVNMSVTSKGIEERLCGSTFSCHTQSVWREPSRRRREIFVAFYAWKIEVMQKNV